MNTPDSNMIECPHCSEWVGALAICENCGAELAGDLPALSVEIPASGTVNLAAVSPEREEWLVDTLPVKEPGTKPEMATKPEETPFPVASLNGCPDFVLEYNTARMFIANQVSSFAFRLKPLSARVTELRDVSFRVECHHENGQRMEKRVYGVYGNQDTPVSINFSPSTPGVDIDSEVSLSYIVDGEKRHYVGSFLWDCLDAQASSRGVVENLIVDLKGMSASTASDQNLRILENFNPGVGLSPAEILAQLKLEPVWQTVPLFVREAHDEVSVQEGTSLPITLTSSKGQVIHVLAASEVVIGRARGSSMIQVKVGENGIPPSPSAVAGVSRYHATFRYREGQYYLGDGALQDGQIRSSKNGSWLGGKRMERGNWVLLAPLVAHDLVLAAREAGEYEGVSYELKSRLDVEKPEHASLLKVVSPFRPNEVFVMVHGYAEISDLLHADSGMRLTVREGRGHLVSGSEPIRLRPGSSFRLGEVSWSCLPYIRETS